MSNLPLAMIGLIATKIMAKTLTATEREQKNSVKLGDAFVIPGGIYEISKVDYDEEDTEYNCPLKIFFKEGGFKTSVRAFYRTRLDYNNKVVERNGTLNQYFVNDHANATQGEIIELAKTDLLGRKVAVSVLYFRGVDKNGDIRQMSVNNFEFAD